MFGCSCGVIVMGPDDVRELIEVGFLKSDLGAALASHPHIEGLTMRDWAVDEQLTAVTRGILQAV